MARVIITASADDDTARILDYLTDQGGAAAAIKYNQSFEGLYDRLAQHPEIGAPRYALAAGLRLCPVPPYLVFYRYDAAADVVAIVRVLHGRREITKRILGVAFTSAP